MKPSVLEDAVAKSVKLLPNTRRSYLAAVREFVGFAGADSRRWTGDIMVNFRTKLARRLKVKSVNTRLAALRFAVRRAIDLGTLTGPNFARVAEFLPEPLDSKPRRAVPIEVGERILAACAGNGLADLRDRAMIALGFYFGVRRESIATLEMDRLDLRRNEFTVVVKGRRLHTITLHAKARRAIEPWLAALRAHRAPLTGRVFRRLHRDIYATGGLRIGKELSAAGVSEVIKIRAEVAGYPKFHAHLMRHCFISWALENGATEAEVMAVTGHRSLTSFRGYRSPTKATGKLLIPDLEA